MHTSCTPRFHPGDDEKGDSDDDEVAYVLFQKINYLHSKFHPNRLSSNGDTCMLTNIHAHTQTCAFIN